MTILLMGGWVERCLVIERIVFILMEEGIIQILILINKKSTIQGIIIKIITKIIFKIIIIIMLKTIIINALIWIHQNMDLLIVKIN